MNCWLRMLRGLQFAPLLQVLVLLVACSALPSREGVEPSYHMAAEQGSELYKKAQKLTARGEAENIFLPLGSGELALGARYNLVNRASTSIDIQYYIWKADNSGTVLAAALLAAAQRGVRVRLLLDDWGEHAKDHALSVINQHPNIQIRLYNPLSSRWQNPLATMMEFNRINRRMHNKTFTVDGAFTILGGRNIADEYFNSQGPLAFADLDVLLAGKVVAEVQASFDQFWNFQTSYPMESIVDNKLSNKDLVQYYQKLEADAKTLLARHRISEPEGLVSRLHDWYPARAQLLTDHPGKSLVDSDDSLEKEGVLNQLDGTWQDIEDEVFLVSPYFVPGKKGVEILTKMARKGVEVSLLTNSLAGTDSAAVYAGYAKYRRALLEAGVNLYELRPDVQLYDTPLPDERPAVRSSLHAKAFFFDRRDVFIGSLNLDPRSIEINTEVGVILRSPEYAEKVLGDIEYIAATDSYRLKIDDSNNIVWLAGEGATQKTYTHSPETSAWLRFKAWFMGLMPIESQL